MSETLEDRLRMSLDAGARSQGLPAEFDGQIAGRVQALGARRKRRRGVLAVVAIVAVLGGGFLLDRDRSGRDPVASAPTFEVPGPDGPVPAGSPRSQPPPMPPPCPADQSTPSMDGHFCGPTPGPGNGLGPGGSCTGQETVPPCGPGAVPGKYYEYTLPGRCSNLIVFDGRVWESTFQFNDQFPTMSVWMGLSTQRDPEGIGFISPNGAVGFKLASTAELPSCRP